MNEMQLTVHSHALLLLLLLQVYRRILYSKKKTQTNKQTHTDRHKQNKNVEKNFFDVFPFLYSNIK